MNRAEFLTALGQRLSGIPEGDRQERLAFYAEMIDDRMEEGLTESEAVEDLGSIDKIVGQIMQDIPLASLVKARVKPERRMAAWEIVLLVLGSPLWLALLLAAAGLLLALYAVLASCMVALWATEFAFIGSALGLILGGVVVTAQGMWPSGLALVGASFVCTGLAILGFFACKALVGGLVSLMKKIVRGTKSLFIQKEAAQ